jgi:GNAT superfamily N-acetyltransferase
MIEIHPMALDDLRLIARCEPLHRQLRPNLPADYLAAMRAVLSGGAQGLIALEGSEVLALALFRVIQTTICPKRFYVDDLVTDERRRSQGVGAALIRALEAQALASGCEQVDLESGTQRVLAHRFYYREGFEIRAFSFHKALRG